MNVDGRNVRRKGITFERLVTFPYTYYYYYISEVHRLFRKWGRKFRFRVSGEVRQGTTAHLVIRCQAAADQNYAAP